MRPRPYLSFSQLTLIEKSPAQYVERYIYDKQIPISRRIAMGKVVHDGTETDDAMGDPVIDMVIAKIPKLPCRNKEWRGKMKTHRKAPSFDILIKPDSAEEDLSALDEYKTGKKWTQRMADENDQITFYAMGAYLITGKIPQRLRLIWIPTEEDEGGRIEVTGEVITFHTRRNWQQILNMMVRAKAGWEKIEKVCNEALA